MVPGVSAARPSTASGKLPVKRVDSSVAFEELRFRSYPSFTRIVVEAAARLSYLTAAGRARSVRLSGLNGPVSTSRRRRRARQGARLESVGARRRAQDRARGPRRDVKTASLQDPFRVVVDIYRAKENAGTESSAARTAGRHPSN